MSALKKDIRITIRFSQDEISEIEKIVQDTGWTQSETLRKLIFDNANNYKEKTPNERMKIDKLLFYFNKTSNNLNQIAKILNTAHIDGKLTDKRLMTAINELIKINDNFHYGLAYATRN